MLRRYANLYVLEILELGYVIFFFFGSFGSTVGSSP